MPIEVTTKQSKDGLSGDERVVAHDPASSDKVAVFTLAELAEYITSAGLVGSPTLADLTITPTPVDIDAAEGTVVATISGKNPTSTLSVSPSGYFTISQDNTQILKGASSFSLAGEYPVAVTETLNGSANSPKVNTANIQFTRDPTPELGAAWSPDYFPELFVNIWVQEDVPDGPVASHTARGWLGQVATQTDAAKRPTKLAEFGGVQCAALTAQHLVIPNVTDGEKLARWAMVVFRVDTSSAVTTNFFVVNDVFSSGGWLPNIAYRPDVAAGRIRSVWRGQAGDSASWVVDPADAAVTDGDTWNVHLTMRRNGRVYGATNGGELTASTSQSVPFTCAVQTTAGRIGMNAATGSMWAYDVIIMGQKELSDAQRQKLEGWAAHRRGFQGNLPVDHPYRSTHPVVDADDFSHTYEHDPVAWAAFGVEAEDNNDRFVNRGGTPPAEPATIVVFRDDFRADSVVMSGAPGQGPPGFHHIWFAPGHNSAVGVNATLNNPDHTPDCYVHDPVGETMTLRLQHDISQGRWETGAFYSIDNAGTGRCWGGERIFEMRVKFPATPVVNALFPAFWGYALEHMFNRIGERIEIDFFEHDGTVEQWLNGLASHVHAGQFPGRLGHLSQGAESFKVCGFNMNVATVGVDIDNWDDNFHVWQVRILNDFTYLIVDDIEMARVPTPDEYLEKSYLIADMAYRASLGAGNPGDLYDMIIDYIEVRQPTTQVESFAAPFTARPTLSGTAQEGEVITCDPNLPADLEATADFWWYRSGYPIVGEDAATYTLTAADVGSEIRCMVKAVGATDQPEAWTDETATVIAA